MRSGCGVEPQRQRSARSHQITEPLRPATISSEAGLPGVEPGPARLELAMLPVTPQAFESGRPGSNGPLRSGAPVLFRLSCVRQEVPPGWSRTSGLCRRRTALYPLSYGRRKMTEPPAGVEPAPRPYKGRVLSVDTTEAKVETAGVEPAPPRCKRGALPPELHPPADQGGLMRTDGVEPPQYEAPRLQRGELTSCSASAWVRVAGRARTGADGAHNPGCFRLHHGHHESGDDRTRTGGLSPDKRALWRV
jgi:hypothetical protein